MVPKRKRICHVNNMVLAIGIRSCKMFHDPNLHHCLVMKAALIANQLDGHILPGLVVAAL